ncbi:helix-turn-helix domain-containing protein [Phenylobacterium zucineum]|nr:helix-turn-helix transcriptional regulator [Phenylobacterium zucineum]
MLKALRRQRGLKAADVAGRMGMPLRSYEHFESGKGRIDVERIHQFAEVLDVDPYGIVLGLELASPSFALRCADNKAGTILLLALQDFDAGIGDELRALDPHTLMRHLTEAFDLLGQRARVRRVEVEAWMHDPAIVGPPRRDESS